MGSTVFEPVKLELAVACIIKLPGESSKGIISFTTPEELQLRSSRSLVKKLNDELKQKYVLCLHYNWHNHNAKPDSLFDVHFAGKEDLIVTNNQRINLFEFDACNFSKSDFNAKGTDKFWDILYVARAVHFKGVDDFLATVRQLYDLGYKKRVLFICPMPPKGSSKKNVHYDIRKKYNQMFTEEEKDLFNLLIISDRYPFFFDRPSLAHFYRSSRIFVHTAPDERRCRVAAYAWSCGLPVIGKECVASILPSTLRKEPAYFIVDEKNSYLDRILQVSSLLEEESKLFDEEDYQKFVSEIYMIDKMKHEFEQTFPETKDSNSDLWFTSNLDIRLGRHHSSNMQSPNHLPQTLESLITDLLMPNQLDIPANQNDPEKFILKPWKKNKLSNFLDLFLKK